MKHYSSYIISLITILLICIIYFFHLWYPIQKLIVTPDIGTSDAINLSLSQKYALWQSYKSSELPLWDHRVNAGFPMFAEGQIGALYLPNIILYRFLPFIDAYNASFIIALTLIAWGFYLWCRTLSISPSIAFLAGLTMAFSGSVIPHLTHITLIQSFSLLPIIIWLTARLARKPSWWIMVSLMVVISQQIFAGFIQAVFITCILCLYLSYVLSPKSNRVLAILAFLASIIFAAGLSAIQILPSQEFLSQTTARDGFNQSAATQFSFRFDNVLTLIHPFFIGNPKNATYDYTDNSIFWENNLYVGFLPLSLIGFIWLSKRSKTMLRILLLPLFFSALLMTGKFSPIYMLYDFWPFHLFRVPSRFSVLFIFLFISISALVLNALVEQLSLNKFKRTLLILILIGIQGYAIIRPWQSYHIYDSADKWISAPQIAASIIPNGTVLSLHVIDTYKKFFITKGFMDIAPFRFMQNYLQPYVTLLWSIPHIDTYPSRFLRRPIVADLLLQKEVASGGSGLIAPQDSPFWHKFLTVLSIRNIISASPIDNPFLKKSAYLHDPWNSVYLYENPDVVPYAYFATDIHVAKTINEAKLAFQKDSFIPGTSAIVETPIDISLGAKATVQLLNKTNTVLTMKTQQVTGMSLLVIQNSWYPGWNAYVDGVKKDVFPVNIRYSGVTIPANTHEVILRFEPTSFLKGKSVSTATLLAIALVSLFLLARPINPWLRH